MSNTASTTTTTAHLLAALGDLFTDPTARAAFLAKSQEDKEADTESRLESCGGNLYALASAGNWITDLIRRIVDLVEEGIGTGGNLADQLGDAIADIIGDLAELIETIQNLPWIWMESVTGPTNTNGPTGGG